MEERIREKGELVEDVKMFERDKYRTCEDVCDNIESAEEMDLSENNDTNEVLVTQEDSLSVEEKRANSYEDVNNERTTENIEETPDSSISNEHVEAKCDINNDQDIDSQTCDTNSDSSIPSSDSASSDISNNNNVHSIGNDSISPTQCDNNDLPQDKEEDFNSFQYWRLPLPEIDTSLTEEHKTDDNQLNSVYAREYDTELTSSLDGNSDINDFDVKKRNVKNGNTESGMIENENNEFRQIMTADVCTLHEVTETVDNIGSTHVIGDQLKELTLQNNGNTIHGLFTYPFNTDKFTICTRKIDICRLD